MGQSSDHDDPCVVCADPCRELQAVISRRNSDGVRAMDECRRARPLRLRRRLDECRSHREVAHSVRDRAHRPDRRYLGRERPHPVGGDHARHVRSQGPAHGAGRRPRGRDPRGRPSARSRSFEGFDRHHVPHGQGARSLGSRRSHRPASISALAREPALVVLEELLITHVDGGATPLVQALDARVREGELIEKLDDMAVRCVACGHRCLVKPGRRGICKVRFNKEGTLLVPAGYVAALQCDPTEKKPFFHCLPGSDTLTFGMLGCDFHCGYCQNWLTSQALRDDNAGVMPNDITPDALVSLALREGARMVGSSYNEPLITAEWAVDVFKLARSRGLKTAFISNGNATPEVLDYIRPWTDCYKIDLKAMSDKRYRELGGVLQHVLDAIRMVHERGFWIEIVTLIVPGFNDDEVQLTAAAQAIASVSPEIPWHVTAFHRDYKMTGPANTSAATLVHACGIGVAAGLQFVYGGNLPGRVGRWEHTYCPDCGDLLIERSGYVIRQQRVGADGRCPSCSRRIPGIWSQLLCCWGCSSADGKRG